MRNAYPVCCGAIPGSKIDQKPVLQIACIYILHFWHDIFAPQKLSFLKISDDVIACDLWFGPPPIEDPDYAYAPDPQPAAAWGFTPRPPKQHPLLRISGYTPA